MVSSSQQLYSSNHAPPFITCLYLSLCPSRTERLFGFSSCLCSLAEGFFPSTPFQIYSSRREARAYSTHFPSVQKAAELIWALLSPGAFLSSFPEMEPVPVLSLAWLLATEGRMNVPAWMQSVAGDSLKSWAAEYIFCKSLPFSSINSVIFSSY